MLNNIKVSIITVSYNSVNTIEQTILSVLKQTYRNIEYLIIDGKSTDGTQELIKKYSDFIDYYVSERDSGIYDTMNKGILHATGDIIGIINSDDWYEVDALEKIINCFNCTNDEVIYGEIWLIDKDGNKEYHTKNSLFPPHPSMFVKREIYYKYGTFNLKYKISADYELILCFLSCGVSFKHIEAIVANFRTIGISNQKLLECSQEAYEISLQYINKYPKNILNKKDIEERYNRKKLIYISQCNPDKVCEVLRKKSSSIKNGIVIFGIGIWGRELYTILKNCHIPILFFVNNDEKKWGLEFKGIKIFSPEILRNYRGYVLIAIKDFEDDICK